MWKNIFFFFFLPRNIISNIDIERRFLYYLFSSCYCRKRAKGCDIKLNCISYMNLNENIRTNYLYSFDDIEILSFKYLHSNDFINIKIIIFRDLFEPTFCFIFIRYYQVQTLQSTIQRLYTITLLVNLITLFITIENIFA